MLITEEELKKLCNGCSTFILSQHKCWLLAQIKSWVSPCPCSGCIINSVCREICLQYTEWRSELEKYKYDEWHRNRLEEGKKR